VADSSNNTIRKITPDGKVTTLAGKVDGFAEGRLNNPFGVAVGWLAEAYVADSGNNAIRKIQPHGGMMLSMAPIGPQAMNPGSSDGNLFLARFSNPQGLVADWMGPGRRGYLYVADTGNGTLRRISFSGSVTTLLRNGDKVTFGEAGGGDSVKFSNPAGVAIDEAGNLYVADTGANCIRKITAAK
jgi:DNA-binding beta-propeller fold protein YncE